MRSGTISVISPLKREDSYGAWKVSASGMCTAYIA